MSITRIGKSGEIVIEFVALACFGDLWLRSSVISVAIVVCVIVLMLALTASDSGADV